MNPKDKRTNQLAGGDAIEAPSTGDAAQPPHDEHDEARAMIPETPAVKSVVVQKQPPEAAGVASPPAASAAAASTWSPPNYPSLVFGWSVVRTNDPAVLRFPTTVNLYTTNKYPGVPAVDPQSLLVDATLSSDRKRVTFSVSEEAGLSPFLSGTLNYEPGSITASLTVTNLKYPGGAIPRQVLYS